MKYNIRPLPISNLFFRSPPVINTEAILEVEGYLPDAAYELLEEKVSIDKTERIVIVRINGKRDPNLMAAQVVRNFKKDIPITFEIGGNWKIQCNDKNLEITIE